MRYIDKIIKNVLSEEFMVNINEQKEISSEKVNVDDFIIYPTSTGGALMIPNSAKPEIIEKIDKSKFKSKLDTIEKILNYVKNKPFVSIACNTYHSDLPYDECAAKYVQELFNKWVDGGVKKFSVIKPTKLENGEIITNRVIFNACWRVSDGSKYLDFKDIRLSGYYPESEVESGNCEGNPWSNEIKSYEESTDKDDFQGKIKFQIKLQMNK
jgi:flavodoxin